MSALVFSRFAGTLAISGGAVFRAGNNVDSRSLGEWQVGQFHYSWYDHGAADGAEGSYGLYGVLVFAVPKRTGMGIHSGRATTPDGLGRVGTLHCTFGCIRTTDEAMAALVALHLRDPIASVLVTL